MTLYYAFYEKFNAAHYLFTIYYHQRACPARNLTMLHTRVESLSFRDCKLFISFSLQAPEWGYSKRVAFFGEVESSWRWTLLHDVLRRRFLEIYNFRNWSATHGYVFMFSYTHCWSAEEKRNDYKFGWSFETSFSLLFACKLLALLHLHVEALLASGQIAVALILRWFLLRKHMCDDEVGKCVTKDPIKLYEQPGAMRDEKLLCISISRSNLTHFQIILLLCLEFFLSSMRARSRLSLTLPGSFVLFVCIITPPEAWDGDWIENWVFSFRISRNIQSKKCANNGWLKGKVKR